MKRAVSVCCPKNAFASTTKLLPPEQRTVAVWSCPLECGPEWPPHAAGAIVNDNAATPTATAFRRFVIALLLSAEAFAPTLRDP